MCSSLYENIAPHVRLVTAFIVRYSSLTELYGSERNRQNTISILLKGGRSSLCSLHQLVFGSWISLYSNLLTALVKVAITILWLVVSIIVKNTV